MAKQACIIQTGTVREVMPNVMCRVELDCNGSIVLCTSSGKMKQNYIKLIVGDRVQLEMSPYDLTRGRVTKRL